MNDRTLEMVAERFRVLGDPLRLRLLQAMGTEELSVGELVTHTATSQANVSKHLGMMLRAGLIRRRKEGLKVFYAPADPSVFKICDLVCGSLQDRLSRELSDLGGPAATRTRRPRAAGTPRRSR
jgi:DNA-binding transcriptional ArsR family regulator